MFLFCFGYFRWAGLGGIEKTILLLLSHVVQATPILLGCVYFQQSVENIFGFLLFVFLNRSGVALNSRLCYNGN